MVDAVEEVLGLYHDRMEQEDLLRREGPPPNMDPVEWRERFLLAVGPDTGRLINILVKSLTAPRILELGTSYGYSAIWLGEAARESGGHLTTIELQDFKSAHAHEMSQKAGLAPYVDFKIGDAVKEIEALPFKLDFVLVDLWKDLYVPCLEAFYPKLNPGAIVVADNMIRPGPEGTKAYAKAVRAKPSIRSVLLPVGSGLEVSVFEG